LWRRFSMPIACRAKESKVLNKFLVVMLWGIKSLSVPDKVKPRETDCAYPENTAEQRLRGTIDDHRPEDFTGDLLCEPSGRFKLCQRRVAMPGGSFEELKVDSIQNGRDRSWSGRG